MDQRREQDVRGFGVDKAVEPAGQATGLNSSGVARLVVVKVVDRSEKAEPDEGRTR